MTLRPENYDPRPILIAAAQQFYRLGWMMGTAGNLSARVKEDSFWITASGKQKGSLTRQDFVRVSSTGQILELPDVNNRPSAETSIHQVIYRLFPEAKACYHVHSVEANLVSHFYSDKTISLPPLEMLKGLGVWEENSQVKMTIFENHLNVQRIADEIDQCFSQSPPAIPALLIRNHGVTVWASSLSTAQNYIEIVEYIFRYLIGVRQYDCT